MSYRNGTYLAFDGGGNSNITSGDIKYFNLMKGWRELGYISFIDSHDKNGSVKDSSLDETLKRSLRERLQNTKKMILIISKNTRANNEILNYEIDYASKNGIDIHVIKIDGNNSIYPNSIPRKVSSINEEFNLEIIKKICNV